MVTNDIPDWASVVARPDTILTGSPLVYTAGSHQLTFTVPTGVHVLSLVAANFSNLTSLSVVGSVTGLTYFSENPSQDTYQHQYYVLIPAGADASVVVEVVATGSGSVYVTGVSDTVAVAALPQNPAPWQGPNQQAVKIQFFNPGQNNTVIVLPGLGSAQAYWLHSMTWMYTVASGTMFGNWQDNVPNVMMVDQAVVAGGRGYMDFKGAKLPAGAPFQFLQTGAAAANITQCFGSLTYSVY